MPLKEISLHEEIKYVTLYLYDLLWIEERLGEFDVPKYKNKAIIKALSEIKEIAVQINNQDYSVNSVQELVSELAKRGINTIDYLVFNGFCFTLRFGILGTSLGLTSVTDINRGKFYQILEYLKTKQNKTSDQQHAIYLYDKHPVKEHNIGTQSEPLKVEVVKPIDVKDSDEGKPFVKRTKIPNWVWLTLTIIALIITFIELILKVIPDLF